MSGRDSVAGTASARGAAALAAGALIVVMLVYGGRALIGGRDAPAARAWDDPITGTRFRLVAAATFAMGTPEVESRREPHELLHEVRITRRFYLAEHEVTQAQWHRVMGENPSYFTRCGGDCPVERVSWHDAQRFVGRLNQAGKPGFRLPTEAEWELACRGASNMAFGGSRGLSSHQANVNGRYAYHAPPGGHRATTTRVRRFDPNWTGLYDMAGNVWEWVEDEYCPYPPAPAVDPVGACGSSRRVLRGGSWAFDAGSARCGSRYAQHPAAANSGAGLRLAHDAF
jgi:formylglycine-generating enzyme required for sulfatase activity